MLISENSSISYLKIDAMRFISGVQGEINLGFEPDEKRNENKSNANVNINGFLFSFSSYRIFYENIH